LEGDPRCFGLFCQRFGFGKHRGKFRCVFGCLCSDAFIGFETGVCGGVAGGFFAEPLNLPFSCGFFGFG